MSDTAEAIEAQIEALKASAREWRVGSSRWPLDNYSSMLNELEVRKIDAQKRELERSIWARAKRAQGGAR